MINVDENNAIASGSPETILSDLTIAIRAARERLRDSLPCLDADDMVRDAIRIGMMSDEDFEKFLDDQRKRILGEE